MTQTSLLSSIIIIPVNSIMILKAWRSQDGYDD